VQVLSNCTRRFPTSYEKGQLDASETRIRLFRDRGLSGYTGLSRRGRTRACQDIIADVMDTMVRRLRPPFRLAKFEGDAAFFYAVAEKVDGSVPAGRRGGGIISPPEASSHISQATSCACNRVQRMQDLDLKFVCHHGEFIKQKMSPTTNSPAATSSWCTAC